MLSQLTYWTILFVVGVCPMHCGVFTETLTFIEPSMCHSHTRFRTLLRGKKIIHSQRQSLNLITIDFDILAMEKTYLIARFDHTKCISIHNSPQMHLYLIRKLNGQLVRKKKKTIFKLERNAFISFYSFPQLTPNFFTPVN